jgi:hypothetical protein
MDILRDCVTCFAIQALPGGRQDRTGPYSESFHSRGVGANARIKLDEFQFRCSREANHCDLQLTSVN